MINLEKPIGALAKVPLPLWELVKMRSHLSEFNKPLGLLIPRAG